MMLPAASLKRIAGLLERSRQLRSGVSPPGTTETSVTDQWAGTYFGGRKRRLRRFLTLFSLTPGDLSALRDVDRLNVENIQVAQMWLALPIAHDSQLPISSLEGLAGILCRSLMCTAEHSLWDHLQSLRKQGAYIADEAVISALHALFGRLAMQLTPTLALELHLHRLRFPALQPTEALHNFCNGLRDHRSRRALWSRYPVLWAQLGVIAQNTVAAVTETLTRLTQDFENIMMVFDIPRTETIQEIKWGVGDTHCNGRSVATVVFCSRQIMYKPRSLASERLFNAFAEWFHSIEPGRWIATCQLIDMTDYGYVEHIPKRTCRSADEIDRFYERIGVLIGVSWLLGIADLHFENLVAHGEFPYLVDLEAILSRAPALDSNFGYEFLYSEAFQHFLFGTCLLPMKALGAGGVYDVSAIGSHDTPASVASLLALQTDADGEIRLLGWTATLLGQNLPSENSELEVSTFAGKILHGHGRAMEAFKRNGDALRTFFAPHPLMRHVQSRWVPRRTQDYFDLLEKCRHPSVLTDALDRDMLLATLWSSDRRDSLLDRLAPSELADIANADIPFFYSEPDCTDLIDSRGQRIAGFFETTGTEALNRRLKSIEQVECPQKAAIRLALASAARLSEPEPMGLTERKSDDSNADAGGLMTMVEEIAEQILDRAIFVDGIPFWPGLRQLNDTHYGACVLPPTLYDGAVGIGVFFAALYQRTGDARIRGVVEGIHRLCNLIIAEPNTFADCGAYSGIGGVIYGRLLIARALELPTEPLPDATLRALATALRHTKSYDIVSGAAGAIVCLVRHFQHTGQSAAIDIAGLAATRLIKRARRSRHGIFWPSAIHENGLGGLAHGAIGIAWSLAELHSVGKHGAPNSAIAEVLRFEDSLFDPEAETWIDARSNTPSYYWCHGATGIGLAAARLHELRNDAQSADMLVRAGRAVSRHGKVPGHCLCHGLLGNLELCLKTDDGNGAHKLLARALATKEDGRRWLCSPDTGFDHMGLMCGISGIGYQLLRYMDKAKFPSVLTLDV